MARASRCIGIRYHPIAHLKPVNCRSYPSHRFLFFTMVRAFVLLFALLAVASGASVKNPVNSRQIGINRELCRAQDQLICNLTPVGESNVTGFVLFTALFRPVEGVRLCVVRVRARISGLSGRRHGIHIHTYGDTSDLTSGLSTGGHFLNPQGTPVSHGLPNSQNRHWGDFGNLRVVDGNAFYSRIDRVISLRGIVGRGITIHDGRDMGAAEQPTGASGPRVAICTIGFANPDNIPT